MVIASKDGVGIKLDKDRDYLYVSTMHDIQEIKLKGVCLVAELENFLSMSSVFDNVLKIFNH